MKVVFNIKKLQLQKITSLVNNLPTYDETVMKVPGTVSLSLESEETSDPFYADGIGYYLPKGAETQTGTLENAWFTDEVLKAIYAYVVDSFGNLVATDGQVSEFGMQFACDSDDGEVYFTYYRVSSTKPGLNVTTNAPGATINPQSVNITANTITLADGTTNALKSFATKTASNYATYFEGITVPVIPASV